MNRYPLWKYILILFTLVFGTIYTLPNFLGESPALQINSGKTTVKVESNLIPKIESILKEGGVPATGINFDYSGTQAVIRARFTDTDTQFKAKAILEHGLNPDQADPIYTVAFSKLPNTPKWMQKIHALPMVLGLDLQGGAHFLLKVDTETVLKNKLAAMQASVRSSLKDKEIKHAGISRDSAAVTVKFRDLETRVRARELLSRQMTEANVVDVPVTGTDGDIALQLSVKPDALVTLQNEGVKQNIEALSKRIAGIGVTEPLIQQQGPDRIVVQLPGVQDVAQAKSIIGRTATLEVRLVDETVIGPIDDNTTVPFGSELFKVGRGGPAILYKDPVVTGDVITGAAATLDENQQPAVSVSLNSDGGRKMREGTRANVGKRMAIVLFEKGKGELLTVATIQQQLGSDFRITGMGTGENSAELALLLRSGALAAPMEVIEERTIGPQLGKENIRKGIYSTMYGFAAMRCS